jgi:hypothetical protein
MRVVLSDRLLANADPGGAMTPIGAALVSRSGRAPRPRVTLRAGAGRSGLVETGFEGASIPDEIVGARLKALA